jgi:hypothetical protein
MVVYVLKKCTLLSILEILILVKSYINYNSEKLEFIKTFVLFKNV